MSHGDEDCENEQQNFNITNPPIPTMLYPPSNSQIIYSQTWVQRTGSGIIFTTYGISGVGSGNNIPPTGASGSARSPTTAGVCGTDPAPTPTTARTTPMTDPAGGAGDSGTHVPMIYNSYGCFRVENLDEVGRWLAAKGLQDLVPIFRKEEIDFVALELLEEKDLEEIGVRSKGHKKRLLHFIKTKDWLKQPRSSQPPYFCK